MYRAGLSARSIARHITTLRNFYSFLAREGEIDRDPTEYLASPRQWTTLPKYLNREEVERLLGAPAGDKADRAAGSRHAASCCTPPGCGSANCAGWSWSAVERDLGVLRVTGKGNKQRLVPFGESAREAIDRYLGDGAAAAAEGAGQPVSVRDRRGAGA